MHAPVHPPTATATENQTPPFGRGLWQFSLGLVVAALCVTLLAWLAGERLADTGHSDDLRMRQIRIGVEMMSVPANLIRFAGQRRSPTAERLDLHLHWPSMSGYSERLSEVFAGTAIDPSILFVTVEPRQMRLDMSARAAPLYSKFLVGPETDAGHGLKRRMLSPAAGFLDEDLVYEPAGSTPFATRCMRAGEGSATAYCMRDIQIGRSLTVTYRFHRSLLADWRRLDAAIRQISTSMLVEGSEAGVQPSRSMSRIAMEKL